YFRHLSQCPETAHLPAAAEFSDRFSYSYRTTENRELATENWFIARPPAAHLQCLSHVGHRRTLSTRSVDHGNAARAARRPLRPRGNVRPHQTLRARINPPTPRR